MAEPLLPHTMRLFLLGPFRLETSQGQPLRLSRRKAQNLLAYLALHPGPQPRERLALSLAGENSGDDTRRLLRVLLTELRKTLGQAAIVAERDTLALAPAFFDPSDLDLLDRALAEGDLAHALALWRGELLTGVDDAWVLPLRALWLRRLCDALALRLAKARTAGLYDEALKWGRHLLSLEPAQERTHQHLMFCLMARGDRQGALDQYRQCQSALAQHLAAQPSAETEAMRQRVEQLGDSALAALPTNLPRPLTSFVGRESALETLAELLAETRMLSLCGMGGYGKTRLAIQLAEEVGQAFPDGVWWLALAPLSTASQIAQALARVLRVKEDMSQPALEGLVAHLKHKKALLLLDNAEHVLGACGQLAEHLLRHCSGLKLLVTSRQALAVPGEVTWQVPPLPVPRHADLRRMQATESVRLLLARSHNHGLQLTDDNADAVWTLCQRLEGVPLAIELAAAQLRQQSLAEVVAGLAHTLDALVSTQPEMAPRQRSLAAMVQWSYTLLSPAEQALFRRLAVFADGASVDSATVVAGGFAQADAALGADPASPLALPLHAAGVVEPLLERLAAQSLLQRRHTTQGLRYSMLDTLRQFAWGQLAERGERQAMQARHAQHWAQWLAQEAGCQYSTEEAASMDRLKHALPELRNMLAFELGRARTRGGDLGLSHQALGAWGRFCYIRGYYREGRDWFTQLEQHSGLPALDRRRAEICNALGLILWQSGLRPAAKDALLRAHALYARLGPPASLAVVHNNLACVALDDDDTANAEPHLTEAIAICRAAASDAERSACARVLGMALTNLAQIRIEQHQCEAAQVLLEESLGIRRRMGDARAVGVSLTALANLAAEQGQLPQAQAYILEGLGMAIALQDRRAGALRLVNLARLALLTDQPGHAAWMLGCVEATLQSLQISLSREAQDTCAQVREAAGKALGEAAFAARWTLGQRLSLTDVATRLADPAKAPRSSP